METFNNIDPRDTEAMAEAQKEAHRANLVKRENEMALYKFLLCDAGEKLVEHWVEQYVHTFIAMPHDTEIGVGIKQGQANFAMMVRQNMEQLKKGVKNG